MTVSCDFETRSPVDLKRCGMYVYAEHPDTEILCMAFAFEDEEPQLWTPEHAWLAPSLCDHVRRGGKLRAFNAAFERLIWTHILGPRYGFPVPDMDQWYCTAAEARAMALPRSLGWCADVLKVPTPKDKEGRQLMLKMCSPGKDGEYHDGPEARKRLYEYCKDDVRAERDVAARLQRLGPVEREVYLMDQRMNDRGIRVDAELVAALSSMADIATEEANAELKQLTDGKVKKVTQVQRIGSWLEEQGIETEDLRKHTVRDMLADDEVDGKANRVLEIRAEVGKTSVGKLSAMVRACCADGYARGLHMYHGASTGRWSGKLIQPQNFPRGELKDVEQYIDYVLMAPEYGWLLEEPNAMAIATSLLRACLTASDGHRLIGGDYSQIEARVLGWIAGEPYRDHEYERMAAAIFGVPVEEIIAEYAAGDGERRQRGKDTVLGCGYQMGAERYAEQAWERSGTRVSSELAEHTVSTYRRTKPGIPAFWSDIEMAAKDAVRRPGAITHVGVGAQVRFVVRGQFLWCILPSGRPLAYALPRVGMRQTKWGPREQLSYVGINGYTKKWCRQSSYGGHLTENVVQAMARDIMAEGMLRLDAAGYRPVLTVHDEVVGDVPEGHGSVEEYRRLMEEVPQWAAGCPIAAECWEGGRYGKK